MSNDYKNNADNKKSAYIIGALIGILTTILTMFVFSALLLFFSVDRAYAAAFATISIALGAFVASFFTAKKLREKGYRTGIIIGAVVFVLITIVSFLLGNTFSLNTLFHFIIIIISSLVGGIMGVNANKTKKYI